MCSRVIYNNEKIPLSPHLCMSQEELESLPLSIQYKILREIKKSKVVNNKLSLSEVYKGLTFGYYNCPYWDGIKRDELVTKDGKLCTLPKDLWVSKTEYESWTKEQKLSWVDSVNTFIVVNDFKELTQQYWQKLKNFFL